MLVKYCIFAGKHIADKKSIQLIFFLVDLDYLTTGYAEGGTRYLY